MDLTKEQELRAQTDEYKLKLKIGDVIVPDPFTIKDGWLSEDNGMKEWPSLYFHDIQDYLRLKSVKDEDLAKVASEYKLGKAFRCVVSCIDNY